MMRERLVWWWCGLSVRVKASHLYEAKFSSRTTFTRQAIPFLIIYPKKISFFFINAAIMSVVQSVKGKKKSRKDMVMPVYVSTLCRGLCAFKVCSLVDNVVYAVWLSNLR